MAKNPDGRPASALTVAAALPGGDPLAAALAAGETPSPEMVAASGGVGAMRPVVALGLVNAIVAGVIAVVLLSDRTQVAHFVPMERAPQVLEDRARTIVTSLDETLAGPADSAWGYSGTDYLRYLRTNDQSPGRWENLRAGHPPGVVFWYRQSPKPIATDSFVFSGQVTMMTPALMGRGDRTGATRIALTLCGVHVAGNLIVAHQTYQIVSTVLLLGTLLGRGLLLAAGVYLFYIALEPDVRKRWPDLLVGWSRVLGGRFNDPLVGRDVLLGIAIGAAGTLLDQLALWSPAWVGRAPSLWDPYARFDGGLRAELYEVTTEIGAAVLVATALLLLYFLLNVLLRRRLPATVAFTAILLAAAYGTTGWGIAFVFSAAGAVLFSFVVTRLGLLVLIIATVVTNLFQGTPLTLDPGSWYAPAAFALLAGVAALTLYGFRVTLAGRPLVSTDMLD